MTHINVAVWVTCENQSVQVRMERCMLNSLRAFNVVEGDNWDYLLHYAVVEDVAYDTPAGLVKISAKYLWKKRIISQASDSTDMTIDQVDWGVFQMPLEELSEFCDQQVQTFGKWRRRWVLGQAHVHDLLAWAERRVNV